MIFGYLTCHPFLIGPSVQMFFRSPVNGLEDNRQVLGI
jgi:hypothetical protein